ncbi:MAG: HAMP domain-containing histidine kinase, partial [Oscillochloris sp.]|nr:HAMP domain-containing histidine kinase [Oscillochloris sp.]
SWQACDTCQPAVLDDYTDWAKGRSIYASLSIHAVAEFPIMVGEMCQGVLSISRNKIGHTFGPQDIYRGQLFSQLIAVVLENVRLYDIAQREIAERTEAEIALQRTAHELQEQNTELDAFGHTVAHDLKTPLSAMVGYTQLLQASHRRMSPESIDSDLHMILMSGNKMATIINELLLLASIRQSSATDAHVLDMAMIVSEATTRLDYLITKSHAILICPPTWPEALGYAPWVEEVWANYLSNALKYGGTPPQILLGADPPANGFVRFWVRDNGSGIPDEKQDLLFSAFTRLQPARVDGHGLGLSIVSRIVEKLGGSVGVESTLGVGSTFFFMLPVADGVLSTELP